MQTNYDPALVVLSVLVAIFASYTALTLAGSITQARGRSRLAWLAGGSVAMGVGIWSMHFVGMLAFSMPGMTMAYDLWLMILSIFIAIGASTIALSVVSLRQRLRVRQYGFAGVAMGVAIAGMHYVGMASMRMPAEIEWNYGLVLLSVVIAMAAAFGALWIAFQLRLETSTRSIVGRIAGGVVMGIAISGMHYTGMVAARFVPGEHAHPAASDSNLVATSGLTAFVLIATLVVLALALAGSWVNLALARRTALAEESARLFEEAKAALAAVHEERELRERFVSSLTHDLRTPMTAAKLNAQLMIRNAERPEKIHQLIAKVIENIERGEEMIQNLLDAHRISAHQQLPLHLAECDLVELARLTLEDLAPVLGKKIGLHAEGPVTGWWDGPYLRRVLENLCGNAVKYGDAGRPISVTLTASGRSPGAEVEVSVHNFGPPLTPEEQANLFRIFHRAKSAQESGAKGWGIGLTLVKGVAEAHGGSVRVRSETGSGTTFTVALPRDARGVDASRTVR